MIRNRWREIKNKGNKNPIEIRINYQESKIKKHRNRNRNYNLNHKILLKNFIRKNLKEKRMDMVIILMKIALGYLHLDHQLTLNKLQVFLQSNIKPVKKEKIWTFKRNNYYKIKMRINYIRMIFQINIFNYKNKT